MGVLLAAIVMLLKFCLQMLQNGFDTLDGYLPNLSGVILLWYGYRTIGSEKITST